MTAKTEETGDVFTAPPPFTRPPLTVHEAVSEVMRQVGAIGKGRKAAAEMGGFSFRGIDDALEALHPILSEVGLNIYPRTVKRESEWIGKRRLVTLEVEFDFFGPDGSTHVVGPFVGEGSDSADKAAGKAHSGAWKMMAFEVFTIPIKDASIDSEAYNPREDEPPSLQELWAQATEAVQDATDVEQGRLDNLPPDLAEKVIGRIIERVNDETVVVSNIRDVGPGWLQQWRKVLDKAYESLEGSGEK